MVIVLCAGLSAQPAWSWHRDLLQNLGGFIAPISQQQEVIAGSQLDKVMRERYPATESYALQAYVSQVGKKLATQTGSSYPLTYTVLADTRTANAFAGPGGFIYITTGMINMLENEAQLAAVLAHETTHVTNRHVVKQMQQQNATDLAMVILSRLTDRDLDNRLTRLGEFVLFQRFSREDEYEADLGGIRLMRQAGYNPQGMVQMLDKLAALESRGIYISFLQSHPTPQTRSQVVEEYIQRKKLVRPGLVLDTPRFHQVVP